MPEIATEQTEDEIFSIEFTDEALEVAAFTAQAGAYTQMGLCTLSFCNG